MTEPSENTFISSTPFATQHNALIRAFGILSILLVPDSPLRFSNAGLTRINVKKREKKERQTNGKREEKERDRGTEGEIPNPIPGN